MTQKHHTPIVVGAAANAATFNSVFSDLDAAVNSFGIESELTLDAAGAITVTGDNHTVDTLGDAATDNLDTVNGMSEGASVLIHAENAARTVVIRHDIDNIITNTGEDFSLDDTDKAVVLIKVGTNILAMGAGGVGAGGGGLFSSYVHLSDQKAQNTAGGTLTLGAMRTRDLNTEVDPDGICVLAANQFTLDAGTYFTIGSVPHFQVEANQAQLYNATGAAVLIVGTSEFSDAGAEDATSRSVISGPFTVAAGQALELQSQSEATKAGTGMGTPANLTTEVYSEISIWKVG